MFDTALVKAILIMILLFITFEVMADNPGQNKTYWKPDSVINLKQPEIDILNAENCLIPSYRSNDGFTPQRAGNNPDKHDYFALVRGEFAKKNQIDLVVLCHAADNKSEYLRFLWGGQRNAQAN